jgi:hypothetical protein
MDDAYADAAAVASSDDDEDDRMLSVHMQDHVTLEGVKDECPLLTIGVWEQYSPDSSTGSNGKKESELVQEAFGNRLWHHRKDGPPGLSSVSAARKRLSVPAPHARGASRVLGHPKMQANGDTLSQRQKPSHAGCFHFHYGQKMDL